MKAIIGILFCSMFLASCGFDTPKNELNTVMNTSYLQEESCKAILKEEKATRIPESCGWRHNSCKYSCKGRTDYKVEEDFTSKSVSLYYDVKKEIPDITKTNPAEILSKIDKVMLEKNTKKTPSTKVMSNSGTITKTGVLDSFTVFDEYNKEFTDPWTESTKINDKGEKTNSFQEYCDNIQKYASWITLKWLNWSDMYLTTSLYGYSSSMAPLKPLHSVSWNRVNEESYMMSNLVPYTVITHRNEPERVCLITFIKNTDDCKDHTQDSCHETFTLSDDIAEDFGRYVKGEMNDYYANNIKRQKDDALIRIIKEDISKFDKKLTN